MENLINQENLEDITRFIEEKIDDIPAEYILCGAIGTLLLSSYLKKKGHKKTAGIIAGIAIPIIAVGIKKYTNLHDSEEEEFQNEIA